jgi:hypothetical protein
MLVERVGYLGGWKDSGLASTVAGRSTVMSVKVHALKFDESRRHKIPTAKYHKIPTAKYKVTNCDLM